MEEVSEGQGVESGGQEQAPGAESGGQEQVPAAPWSDLNGPWMIGDKPWYSSIPEEGVRKTLEAKKYNNPAELAIAYSNLLKEYSGSPNVIAIPGNDASAEELDAFYSKLGRPQTPDGYEFQFPEDAPVDDAMISFAKEMFHKLGLNNKHAQQFADGWNEFAEKEVTRAQKQMESVNAQEVSELKQKWGKNFDQFLAAGRRVVESAELPKELIDKVEAAIGTAPVLEFLGKIGMKTKEGDFVGAAGGSGGGKRVFTPAQAQAEINRLHSDEKFVTAFNDPNHAAHTAAVKRMEKLFMQI